MEVATHSPAEFNHAAEDFILAICPSKESATVVGLCGELGAGKTTFVQAAAHALGIRVPITSPTFLIWKRYALRDSRFGNLIHADAYRLKSGGELKKLGFAELLADPANLIFVEWAEQVAEILPENRHTILFTVAGREERVLSFSGPVA